MNPQTKTPMRVHLCWGLFTVLSVSIASSLAFVLGGVLGQQQLYNTWTERKLDKLSVILQSSQFESIETGYSSAARVYLIGTLPNSPTRDALHKQLVTSFGLEEADFIIGQVEIGDQ